MDSAPLRGLLKQFCQTLDESFDRGRTDQDLLQAYAAEGDHAAFAGLVRRHGTLVHGVCRRVLQDHHDAEDAFQATFLVLARKASSIRKQQAVASWLYGVAYRLASKLKLKAARRRSHEKQAAPLLPPDAGELTWTELRGLLDEELTRLPEKFRAPLVLCYLDGKTQDEAARQLDWSLGTFRRRLDQGRELLRERLVRRGLTLSAAMFPALLAQQAGAAVPAPLFTATCEAALLFGAGQLASGTLAVPVALAEGFMKAMLLSKLITLAGGLLIAVGVGVLTVCVWGQRSPSGDAPALASAVEADGEVAEPAQPAGKPDNAERVAFPRRLFAIGVHNYPFFNPVGFGAGDHTVDKLVKRFADRLSIPADQVAVLSDAVASGNARPALPALSAAELARLSDEEVKQMLDGSATAPSPPTKAVIERNVRRFLDSSGPQDRIILMFIGHAVEIDDQAYLVPLEGERDAKQTLIPLSWFYQQLAGCKARQKVFILDVCRQDPDRPAERGKVAPMGKQLDALLAKPPDGVQVLTACTAGQHSYELDNKRKAGVDGGIVLNLLPQLQLKDVQQRPEDSLPIAAIAKALAPRTRYLAQAFLDKEQTPRLSGTEAQTDLAFDPKAPPPPRFLLEATADLHKGIASKAQLESLFKEITRIPPVVPGGDVVGFERDILPVLQAKCGKCHIEPERKKSGLDMRTVASLKKGGVTRPAVTPYDLTKSMLWEAIVQNDMPPSGDPELTAAEQGIIKRWILSGAMTDREAALASPLPGLQFESWPPFPVVLLQPYAEDVKDSPLREKLREAIALLKNPQTNQPFPFEFARNFDPMNPQQYEVFRTELEQIQKQAGLVQFRLDTILEELDAFQGERAKESKRWQAIFDFVRSRLAARIACIYEYNAKLGEMRKEPPPFDGKKHTGWELGRTDHFTDRDAQKYATKSKTYLEVVIRDNPGTPWEFLARRELRNPIGLVWRAR